MKLYINIFLLNFIFSVFTENLQENENEEIPEFFDSRENWPNCIPKIYNQGTCGACYAMSTATTFSTRFCIRNNKSKIINFSPQNLINCLSGCKGEFPDTVWNYINEKGITTDNCLSYQNSQKSCTTKCDSKNIKFKTLLNASFGHFIISILGYLTVFLKGLPLLAFGKLMLSGIIGFNFNGHLHLAFFDSLVISIKVQSDSQKFSFIKYLSLLLCI